MSHAAGTFDPERTAVEARPAAAPPDGAESDGPLGRLRARLTLVEAAMRDFVASLKLPDNLDAAIRHALLAGGKRLRPALAVCASEAVGGVVERALPAAAAVEMVHAFSLVHDDLPALDNDDLRRGMPTVHKAHGEAMAILAGDGLMSLAFQILGAGHGDAALAGLLTHELAVGTTNMIVGQVLDTLGGFPRALDSRGGNAAKLRLVHVNKTGALIRASCRMGAIAGLWPRLTRDGKVEELASSGELRAITDYAEAIGLMFQIVDDLLDVEQTAEHTGKRVSKDAEAGKLTYPGVLGVEASRAEIARLHRAAQSALAPLGPQAAMLGSLCDYMAVRTR